MRPALWLTLFGLVAAPAAAEPAFRQLFSERASASSYLKNNWNRFSENYHPSYLLDGDPKTAWVEGAEGDGHGEHVSWRLSSLPRASEVKLRVRNGYQKSKPLFEANAAPKDIVIELLGPRGTVVRRAVTLARKMGFQEVVLAVPAGAAVDGVRLTIQSTYPGRVYQDTCLSDVETWVRSDVAYNEDAEAAKKARLSAWVKERRAEAAYFQALPPEYPFASTHLAAEPRLRHHEPRVLYPEQAEPTLVQGWRPALARALGGEVPKAAEPHFPAELLADFARVHALAKGRAEGFLPSRYKVELSRRLKLPDGLEVDWPLASFVPSFADLLDKGAVTLAQTAQKSAGRSRAYPKPDPKSPYGPEQWLRRWDASHARIARGEGGALLALAFDEVQVIEERGVYETRAHFLVLYDDEERPRRVLVFTSGTSGQSLSALSFSRDGSGRIATVAYRAIHQASGEELGELGEANHFIAVDYGSALVAGR